MRWRGKLPSCSACAEEAISTHEFQLWLRLNGLTVPLGNHAYAVLGLPSLRNEHWRTSKTAVRGVLLLPGAIVVGIALDSHFALHSADRLAQMTNACG